MQYEKFMGTLREVLGNNNRIVSKAKLPNTVVRQFIKDPKKHLSLQNIIRISEFIDVDFDISFKDKDGKILTDSEIDSRIKKKIVESEEGDSLKIISGAKSINSDKEVIQKGDSQKVIMEPDEEDKIISETIKIDFSDVFGA